MSSPSATAAMAGVALIACAAFGVGVASAQTVGPTEPDSPAQCSNYSTGADAHTACLPPLSAPPGAAIACHDYNVGSDTHTECAPVAQPGLGGLRAKRVIPTPPAPSLHCYTYHIGLSTYTDCR